MRRFVVVLVLAAALLATSEALSMTSNSAQIIGARLSTIQSAGPSKRFLRTVGPPDEEDEDDSAEERGLLGAKSLAYWSKLAEKWEMETLAKKLQQKSWLKEGHNPQTLSKKYSFNGKSMEELKRDPNYLRYEGFDDLWLLAQYKKGTLLKPDKWIKMMEEQAKKAK